MTARQQRMLIVILVLAGVGIATTFGLRAFQENLLYYYSPSAVQAGVLRVQEQGEEEPLEADIRGVAGQALIFTVLIMIFMNHELICVCNNFSKLFVLNPLYSTISNIDCIKTQFFKSNLMFIS